MNTVNSKAVSHIIKDRLRKWIRFLEHHSDSPSNTGDIHFKDVFAVEPDFSFAARVPNRLVHAVHRAKKRRFPTPRRSDECRYPIPGNLNGDVMKSLEASVVEIQILRSKLRHGTGLLRLLPGCGRRHGLQLLVWSSQALISWQGQIRAT